MSYMQRWEEEKSKLRDVLDSEEAVIPLRNVKKPSLIEEIMAFDFSDLDTLPVKKLESFMGALAQFLIYFQKLVNERKIGYDSIVRSYEDALNEQSLAQSGGTMKEKVAKASVVAEIREMAKEVQVAKAKLDSLDKIPDHFKELLQSLKKIYSARIEEKNTRDA